MKEEQGKKVKALKEESVLERPPILKIRDEDMVPRLLTAAFYPSKELRGFGAENRTNPRVVHSYEVVFFVGDGGKCVINNRLYHIHAGDIRVHKPGDVVYSYRYHDIYVVHFSIGDNEASLMANDTLNGFLPFMHAFDPEEFKLLMNSLVLARLHGDFFEEQKKLWELLFELRRHSHKLKKVGLDSRQNQVISAIKSIIREQYESHLSLADIGRQVYLHPNHVHRLFKQGTGITPLAYLTDVRLSHARELLLTTQQSIGEISELCGFCNSSHFISTFKQKYGMTPSAFRRANIPSLDGLI